MNGEGLALRENLVANWRGCILYCSPGSNDGTGARESLWAAFRGDFSTPLQITTDEGGWLDDDLVELSVSPSGLHLVLRGIETCYVAALPATGPETLRLAPHLATKHLYNDLGVLEVHWHPSCDALLLALNDACTISLYDCEAGELLCTSPVALPYKGSIVAGKEDTAATLPAVCSIAAVECAEAAGAFLLFASGADGTIAVLGPYVPPSSVLPRALIDHASSFGGAFENEVLNKVMEVPGGETVVTAPAERLPGGVYDVPYLRALESVATADPKGLRISRIGAVQVEDDVILIAVSAEQLHVFRYPLDTLISGLHTASPLTATTTVLSLRGDSPSLFTSEYSEFDGLLHRYRYAVNIQTQGVANGGVLAVIQHPWGVLLVDEESLVGELKREGALFAGVHLFKNNGAGYGGAGAVVLGAAGFTAGQHPEQQVALLMAARGVGCEILVDHIERNLPETATTTAPLICGTEGTTLRSLNSWTSSSTSTLPVAQRDALHTQYKAMLSGRGAAPASFDTLSTLLASHESCGVSLTSTADTLKANIQTHIAELVEMKRTLELEAVSLEDMAEERKKRLCARIVSIKEDNAKGLYTEGLAGARALLEVSAEMAAKLRCATIESSRTELFDQFDAAGLAGAVDSLCGQEVRVLSEEEGGKAMVLLKGGKSVEVPQAALRTVDTHSQEDSWETALRDARLQTTKIDSKTESVLREVTASFNVVHHEMTEALAGPPLV